MRSARSAHTTEHATRGTRELAQTGAPAGFFSIFSPLRHCDRPVVSEMLTWVRLLLLESCTLHTTTSIIRLVAPLASDDEARGYSQNYRKLTKFIKNQRKSTKINEKSRFSANFILLLHCNLLCVSEIIVWDRYLLLELCPLCVIKTNVWLVSPLGPDDGAR